MQIKTTLSILALCLIANASRSSAQRAPDDTSSTLPAYRINEVVITATRHYEPVLEVPMAVSLIRAQDFEGSRQLGLDEALRFVPGVFAQSRSGSVDARITIRGFGARGNGDRSNAGNLRGIRILRDGIPLTEPDGRTSLDLVDLASTGTIEIVRSNASALYGGASGGVIQLRSTSFRSPYIDASASFGSFGLMSNTISAGLRSGDTKFALSMNNAQFDGWRAHSANSRTSGSAVISAVLAPSSMLTVSALAVTNVMKFAGALTRAEMEADPSQADPVYVSRDERRFNRVGRLGVALDQNIGEQHRISAMVFVEPKYLQRSERNTFRDFNRYHVGGSGSYAWMTTFGSNLSSALQLGFDEAYQDGSIQFYSLSATRGRGATLLQNKAEGANSVGLFAQEELRIGDTWSFVAGVRMDQLNYRSEDNTTPRLNAEKEFRAVTPKLGVSLRLTEEHTVYASLGGGVEAPAFNEIDPSPADSLTSLNPLLDPMLSTTVEAGVKGAMLWNGAPVVDALQYDVAFYYLTVRNDLVPFNGGRWYFTAGKSHRSGVEASIALASPLGLSLTATATFSSNVYDEYANDVFGNLSGNAVAGLPAFFGGARLRYTSPWKVYVEFGARHNGDYHAEDTNSDDSKVRGVTVVEAGVGGKATIGPLGVEGFLGVDNLTDARYVGSVFINGANNRFFEPGLPRNTHGRLRLSWSL